MVTDTRLINMMNCSVVSDLTQSSKVVEVIQKGDLLKSLRSLRELQAWGAPHLLAHLHRSAHQVLSNAPTHRMEFLVNKTRKVQFKVDAGKSC